MGGLVLGSKTSVLVVVDMQNDFCHEKGYHASLGKSLSSIKKIIPNIETLLKAFRELKMPVVYVTQIYEADGSDSPHRTHNILPQFAQARYKSVIAVRDSWGAQVIDQLKPATNDFVIKKRRFSAFYNTDLETILRCRGIKTVIMTGAVTYVCVEHTARDAFIRDYDVIIVGDAVAGWNEEMHVNALKSMAWSTGAILSTTETLETLNSDKSG